MKRAQAAEAMSDTPETDAPETGADDAIETPAAETPTGDATADDVTSDDVIVEDAGADQPAVDAEQGELNVAVLYPDLQQHMRMLEALLFAAAEPLDEETLKARLPKEADLPQLLKHLEALYTPRGVNLVRVGGKWAMRTAADLAFLLRKETTEQRRLSRAGIETLAIVAYHQPVTRAEIEEIRGVGVSKGTLDLLLEIGWVRPRGRRRTPGRPVTYGTTEAFLQHFGLDKVGDLPGMDELKLAGLLDSSVPAGFVPSPSDQLSADEDPLDEADLSELLAPQGGEDA